MKKNNKINQKYQNVFITEIIKDNSIIRFWIKDKYVGISSLGGFILEKSYYHTMKNSTLEILKDYPNSKRKDYYSLMY